MPQILEVFANTGHQYFTIPLIEALPTISAEKLEKIAWNNRGPFEFLAPEIPWLRYQLDLLQGNPATPVLRLAIETNLGLSTRGFLFEVEEVDEMPDADYEIAPFAGRDEPDLQANFVRKFPLPPILTRDGQELPVEVTIYFAPPGGQDWIDVDLIVDLGNTRTAAVLLESPGLDKIPLDQRIYPLRVLPRGAQYETASGCKPVSGRDLPSLLDDCAIIQSWLLLHQTIFAQSEPPSERAKHCSYARYEEFTAAATGKTRFRKYSYLPQSFVELSPALIGGGNSVEGASSIFAQTNLDTDAPFFLSSPKRYVWDDHPQGRKGNAFWFSIPNEPGRKISPLSGLLRYFMEPSGHDLQLGAAPDAKNFSEIPYAGANPTYPRRAAVCWFALSLIEAAYRQINAHDYRKFAGRVTLPRRLRWVRVTYPAGWTSEEKQLYFAEWRRAINLFTLTHLEGGRLSDGRPLRGPALAEDLIDEAVGSQLPIIYAQVQTLMNDGETWINLYGNGKSLVVMNLDIGGGTTDLSVIEYQNKSGPTRGVALSCKLLFRFGTTVAGDMVVKAVIERVLLPTWIKASDKGQYARYPQASTALEALFSRPTFSEIRKVDPLMQRKLARVTRLVLAPLAARLLQKLTEMGDETGAEFEPLNIKACREAGLVQDYTLNDLNELGVRTIRHYCYLGADEQIPPPFSNEAKLVCRPEQINECVKAVFSSMFDNLGFLAARFKCHLVIVSGKPSELPLVRKLLNESFPILPQRIMTVRDFPAGRWYPFATPQGKIQDAKTCTVVGATLFQELVNGELPAFAIRPSEASEFSRQYYWGIIPVGGKINEFYSARHLWFGPAKYHGANESPENRNRLELAETFKNVPLGSRIGRQVGRLRDVSPDPVYELRWERDEDDEGTTDQVLANVTVKWVSIRGKGEHLELVNVEPVEGGFPFNPRDVKLKLNTMLSRDFWMDSPEFDTKEFFAHLNSKVSK